MIARTVAVLTCSTLLTFPTLAQNRAPDRAPTTTRTPTPTQPPRNPSNLVDLRPRFTVGQEVRLNMDIANTSTRTGTSGDTEPKPDGNRTVAMTLVLKCTGVDPDEGYTLDLKIEAFRFNGTFEGEQISWDSKKQGKDEALDAAFGGLIGTAIPMKMDKNGNISDLGASLPGGAGGMGGMMGGGDLFKGLFGPLTSRTGNTGEAKVGDKWTNDDTMQAGLGTVKVRTDNTLKSAGNSMATIATKGTFSLDPSSTGQGLKLREGKLDGETKWNTADHMLESMNMKQKVVLEKREPNTGRAPTTPATSTETLDVKVTRVRTGR